MIKKSTTGSVPAREGVPEVEVNTKELNQILGYSLRRAQQAAYRDYERFMDALNIRPAQLAVLVAIRENPGFTQSAISQTLGIQRANFVSILDDLEEEGWVERRISLKDRRSYALHLTKHGEAMMKPALVAHAEVQRVNTQRLGVQDTKLLLSLLHRFADAG